MTTAQRSCLCYTIILLLLVLTLGACSQDNSGSQATGALSASPEPAGGTVTLGISVAPAGTFNPLLSESQVDIDVMKPVFETLLRPDKELVYREPCLATAYEFSADQTAVTFHLREGVRWHDGELFTADDVAFTFRFMLDPDYSALDNSNLLVIEGAEEYRNGEAETVSGIEVADEHTITVRFTETSGPAFTTLASTYILPKHLYEAYSVASAPAARPTRNPVGTGPYRFVSWSQGELVLERNDDWWGPEPRVGRLVWKLVNLHEASALFAEGVVDVLGVGAASDLDPGDIEGVEDVEVWSQPGFLYDYLLFNLTDPRFQDVRVRQAFAHAIDRERIVDEVLAGQATLVNGPLLPFSWGCPPDVEPYEYDVARARELLREAGWEDGNGDGVLDNGSRQSLQLTLIYPEVAEGDETHHYRKESVGYVEEDLQKVGVALTAEAVDYNALLQEVVQTPTYELGLLGWNLGRDPDQRTIWAPGAVFNLARFENEEAEFMLEEGATSSLDPDERRSFYEAWYRLIHDEAPYVFLYARNNIYAFNSAAVQGYDKEALNPLDNVYEWWVPGE